MHLKTSDPGKLLLNQEPIREWSPLGYWRKLQPFQDWKNSCHQARSRKNSWLRWILGGHRDEKCLAGWSFGARKSDLGVRPCNHAEGDLLETPVPCVYNNTSVTIPPTRQLSYQICPEESACQFRESSSWPRMVRHIDSPSSLSAWRGMPSLEKYSIDLSRLCWQTEELEGPRVWKSSR